MMKGFIRSKLVLTLAVLVIMMVAVGIPLPAASIHAQAIHPTTPTVNLDSVQGSIFANPNDSGSFDITPSTPPVFTQTFPIINFNPPTTMQNCSPATGVDENTRPFTDVSPNSDGSCSTIPVQDNNGDQAGVGNLYSFEAVFMATITVSGHGQFTSNIFSDDGWILSIGPDGSGDQPTYVSGPMNNAPATGPFTGYPVVGANNTVSSPTQFTDKVTFPAAGTYPIELDYTECCGGQLTLLFNNFTFIATAPPYTTSRYMSTVDTATLTNEGCNQGLAKQAGIIVLDFGQPQINNGVYGTTLFNSNNFASTDQITAAVEAFLQAFWNCTPQNGPFITLGIGTSNLHGWINDPTTAFNHGQAWATMVNNVATWISNSGFGSQEAVAGASDMELGYNSFANTKGWADGYTASAQYPYYDYGDAAGCPPAGSCNNGWTQADVVYVSWDEAAALPLPEIYAVNKINAKQWYRLSLYSALNPGQFGRMIIQGSFTQHAACKITGGCNDGTPLSTDNTPTQGWKQLYTKLNSDTRTQQPLDYSTDITWAN